MRLPDSFVQAYEQELAVIEPLRKLAATRLRLAAANHEWLFDDRVKSPESSFSKLEAGHLSLGSMHDLYAAMLVVPTQKHINHACDVVLAAFNGTVKPRRNSNAASFVYDDVHVIASLEGVISPRAVRHPAVLRRPFEIQIHTGVQYAWWRATHDELYKGSNVSSGSWAAQRASGQARASLELVDGVLANFEMAARLQYGVPDAESAPEETVSWLPLWSAAKRPVDEVRFRATIDAISGATEIGLKDIYELLRSQTFAHYLQNPNITAVQAVIIACHQLGGDSISEKLVAADRRVLITDELLAVYPGIGYLAAEARVSL